MAALRWRPRTASPTPCWWQGLNTTATTAVRAAVKARAAAADGPALRAHQTRAAAAFPGRRLRHYYSTGHCGLIIAGLLSKIYAHRRGFPPILNS
jgi:hypothetical protein